MNKIVEIIEMQFSELDLIVKLITDNPGVKKAYTGEDDLAYSSLNNMFSQSDFAKKVYIAYDNRKDSLVSPKFLNTGKI